MNVDSPISRLRYQLLFKKFAPIKFKPPSFGFSIVIITHNRKEFLNEAIRVVSQSTKSPFELIVWDNNSTDGTSSLLNKWDSQQGNIQTISCPVNLGTSAYALAFLRAKYQYLVEMDDDILGLTEGWDEKVLAALKANPAIGYLALNVVQDEFTNGAKPDKAEYVDEVVNGVPFEKGPVGGWFAVTPREVYNRVGGFFYSPRKKFFCEDGEYAKRIRKRGYVDRILKDTYAYHGCGPCWNKAFGYEDLWREKYATNYPEFIKSIDGDFEVIPDMSVPKRALEGLAKSNL